MSRNRRNKKSSSNGQKFQIINKSRDIKTILCNPIDNIRKDQIQAGKEMMRKEKLELALQI